METRLLNDPRFFPLPSETQLTYMKLILVSRTLNNKIPQEIGVIKALLRSHASEEELEVIIAQILSIFPKFRLGDGFYYFDGYDMRMGNGYTIGKHNGYNIGTKVGQPDEDEDEDEDHLGTMKEVLTHLNNKASKHYSAAPANLKFIRARLKDGYTLEDLKRVIDIMVVQWKDDPTMNKYLRPETLFNATKFQTYIQFKYKKEYTRDEINKMRRGETI